MSERRTLGIDLAAQAKKTAIATIRWGDGRPEVEQCALGSVDGRPLTDDVLVALSTEGIDVPIKVGIDAPFGWPVAFVRAMTDPTVFAASYGETRRPHLERRATDHWVHARSDKQPLSVATDRIAYPAMRTGGVLAELDRRGCLVDRTGVTGLVCETYPDPAIRGFGLWPAGASKRASYKGDSSEATAIRAAIVELLSKALSMTSAVAGLCVDRDDALDAVVCALVARAVERGETVPPPEEHLGVAMSEGWIHLPEEGVDVRRLI